MATAHVKIDNPQYELDGRMYVDPAQLGWHEVPYLDPTECDHQETICLGCVDSWECDHEVELPELLYLPGS